MQQRPFIPVPRESGESGDHPAPIPFPRNPTARGSDPVQGGQPLKARAGRDPAGEVLAAFAHVSRRIHDLARELKCLGHFDDRDDRPRAA